MISWWFALGYAAPFEVWSSLEGTSPPPFPVAAVQSVDAPCTDLPFSADTPRTSIPRWCPSHWPPPSARFLVYPALTGRVDPTRPTEQVIPDAWLAPVARQLMPLDTSWRASFFVGTGPKGQTQRLPEGFDSLPHEAWAWSNGDYSAILNDTFELPIGALHAGAHQCTVLGRHGTLTFERTCFLPADATEADLRLFPIATWGSTDQPWMVEARVPLASLVSAAPETQTQPSSFPWLALALGAPLAVGVGFGLGWFLKKSPAALLPPEPEPAPVLPFPAPPEEKPADGILASTPEPPPPRGPIVQKVEPDPYLVAQTKLLEQAPHFRMLAGWLARNEGIDEHAARVAELLEESRQSLAEARNQRTPRAYLDAWNGLLLDVEDKQRMLSMVRHSLHLVLQDPHAARSASPEVAAAWRMLLPHTELKITDKGEGLAAQLRVDLLRLSVGPAMGLAQFQYEGLPLELPKLAGAKEEDLATMALQTASLAEAFGYRYEHVALYGQRDADYVMDDLVTLTPIDRKALLSDLTPPTLAVPGVICRVVKPVFRPIAPQARTHRAQLLFLREPS